MLLMLRKRLFCFVVFLQLICKLSLSKEEYRHVVVKEACKVDTLEVNDKKNEEDICAKIVAKFEEFNRVS